MWIERIKVKESKDQTNDTRTLFVALPEIPMVGGRRGGEGGQKGT